MISFDEAVECVRSAAKPLEAERIVLDEAVGRVLAAPVLASIDSPRNDVSAMDGYAVRDLDLSGFPASLRIIGESFAGARWIGKVEPGTCARIFTGAPVPDGADRVVIQENVRRDGDFAIIDGHPGPARYIRKRASDFSAGDQLLAAGRVFGARAIVVAAAADAAEFAVYRQPRVHIIATGDELVEPGSASAAGTDAVPESVSYGIAALARQWGARCIGRDRVRDDLPAMQAAAAAAVHCADVVVVTGGASVGEKDFAKAMFEPLGLELIFSKLAIKPGKPAWLGRAGEVLLIGLPGNPTSALVTGRLLLASLLAGLTGRPVECALQWRRLPLAAPLPECGERETFHRARLTGGKAQVLPYQDSSAQKTLAEADLLVRQAANSPAIAAGTGVDVLDF